MINSSLVIDSSSINAVKAKVDIYWGATLVLTCSCSDYLQDFTVNRIGEENKFFGYGICQQLQMTLIDLERSLDIKKSSQIKVAYGDGETFVYPHPIFWVEEVTRDEDTNSINIVAYDMLYKATEHTVSEIKNLNAPYSTFSFAVACIQTLPGGTGAKLVNAPPNITHDALPNFEGTETIRQALDAAAEMAQFIYYIDRNNSLALKKLDIINEPVLTISKSDYFSLKTGDNVVLNAICSATELGDNVIHPDVTEGNIQYIRDNPFWALNENMDTVLVDAWEVVNGLAINEFICEGWAGNYLLEVGDKIALETEDGGSVISYVLNDSITFDGTLSETTQWAYDPSRAESANNPTNLGEMLNKTFARVDKANKEITLVASEASANSNRVSQLEIDTEKISMTVTLVQTSTEEAIDAINENFETLSKQVSTKVDAESFEVTVKEIVKETGVDEVETSTGFTFNKDGLNISKSDSEMTTQITEDGMTIKRSGQETLVADNTGVRAENLHATTFLIIGNNSRFEDYGGDRTGCFWIGG